VAGVVTLRLVIAALLLLAACRPWFKGCPQPAVRVTATVCRPSPSRDVPAASTVFAWLPDLIPWRPDLVSRFLSPRICTTGRTTTWSTPYSLLPEGEREAGQDASTPGART
jgi:hypothetical protein